MEAINNIEHSLFVQSSIIVFILDNWKLNVCYNPHLVGLQVFEPKLFFDIKESDLKTMWIRNKIVFSFAQFNNDFDFWDHYIILKYCKSLYWRYYIINRKNKIFERATGDKCYTSGIYMGQTINSPRTNLFSISFSRP